MELQVTMLKGMLSRPS